MILSSQYLVQTVWFQLREWRKNGLEVLKLNISKGPVSRPPLSGSDCLNLVLDFGTTLQWAGSYRGLVGVLAEDKESLKRIADRKK